MTIKPPQSIEWIIQKINKPLQSISPLVQDELTEIKPENLEYGQIDNIIRILKNTRKMIHTARNIENQSEIREQIYAAVAK